MTQLLPRDTPEIDILFRGKDPFADFRVGDKDASLTLGAPAKIGDIDTDALESKIAAEGSPIQGMLRIRIGQKDHFIREVTFEGSGKEPLTSKDMSFKFQMTYPLIEAAPTFTAADFTFIAPPGIKPASPAAAPSKPVTVNPAGKPKSKK